MSARKKRLDNSARPCYLGGELDGEQMQTVRIANGLTQEELAQMLGVSRSYIALMETGAKRINQRTAIAFCTVINQHKAKNSRGRKTA